MFFLFFVGILCVLSSFFISFDQGKTLYLENEYYIPTGEKIEVKPEFLNIIQRINSKNEKVNNFYSSIHAEANRKKIKVNLEGEVYYEKPRRSRIYFNSFLGKESEIGADDQKFWFWSRRMEPRALYYANHEDLHKTKLKAPFNPAWIMHGLNLDVIQITSKTKIQFKNKDLQITDSLVGPNGTFINRLILIDENKKLIKGRYLFAENGDLIASTEIKEYQFINDIPVPKLARTIWYENAEKIFMDWTFNNQKINTDINQKNFIMPDLNPKVDMSKD